MQTFTTRPQSIGTHGISHCGPIFRKGPSSVCAGSTYNKVHRQTLDHSTARTGSLTTSRSIGTPRIRKLGLIHCRCTSTVHSSVGIVHQHARELSSTFETTVDGWHCLVAASCGWLHPSFARIGLHGPRLSRSRPAWPWHPRRFVEWPSAIPGPSSYGPKPQARVPLPSDELKD